VLALDRIPQGFPPTDRLAPSGDPTRVSHTPVSLDAR